MRIYLLLLAFFTAFAACKPDQVRKDISAQISELEKEMAATEQAPSNEKLAELMALYEEHVKIYPNRKSANADYLFKAAETARLLKQYDRAIGYYNMIVIKCGGHPKMPRAFFMKGYTYDNEMNNLDSARIMYEYFLRMYPKNEFADDAKFLLDNLGKSDEEIIEKLDSLGNNEK